MVILFYRYCAAARTDCRRWTRSASEVEADWATAQLQAAVKELAASLRQRRANEIRFSPDAVALALLATSHGE